MSTLATHAPVNTTLQPHPNYEEPDEVWKAGVKAKIEAGLSSMMEDAKTNLHDQLKKYPNEAARLTEEHKQAVENINKLARESFTMAVSRERQERLWSSGGAMHPEWSNALIREQQDILDRIKKPGGHGQENFSPVILESPRTDSPQTAERPRTESPRKADIPPEDRKPVPIMRPLFPLTTVDPLPLPPQLREKAEQDRARNARRSSDAHHSSVSREGYAAAMRMPLHPPMALERPSGEFRPAAFPNFPNNSPDDVDSILFPPQTRTRSLTDRSPVPDSPVGRPIERSGRSASDRHIAHSPPKHVPEFWRPSISPEEDAATSTPYHLARRGSTNSIRSSGSSSFRTAAPIPERPDGIPEALDPVERERQSRKEGEKAWSGMDRAREKEKQGAHRNDNRRSPVNEQVSRYEESGPRSASSKISAPPPSVSTRSVAPSASFNGDDRFHIEKPGSSGGPYARDQPSPSKTRGPTHKQSLSNEDQNHHPSPTRTATRNDSGDLREYPSSSNYPTAPNFPTLPNYAPPNYPSLSNFPPSANYSTLSNHGPPSQLPDVEHHEDYYNYATPDRYAAPTLSSARTARRDHTQMANPDDRIDNQPIRDYSVRPTAELSDSYKPQEGTRPSPSRQASYTLGRNDSSKRQGSRDDRRAFSSPSASIPISAPRHSPNIDDSPGSWKIWNNEHRRPGDPRPDSRSPQITELSSHSQHLHGSGNTYKRSHRAAGATKQGRRNDHNSSTDDTDNDRSTSSPSEAEDEEGGSGAEEEDKVEDDEDMSDEDLFAEDKAQRDEELERERRREEDMEARRKEDEEERRAEMRRKMEEARKREEEMNRKLEEAMRKEEEMEQKEQETKRKEEELLAKERQTKKKEEEMKKKLLDTKKKEEDLKKKEADAKKKDEEAKRKEKEIKRKEAEARRKEEEAQRKEDEAQKKEQEAIRMEEEARRKEDELKILEEETKRKEEDLKRLEEDARRKEEEAQRKEAEILKREQELKRWEEALNRREQVFNEDEKSRREQTQRQKEEEFRRQQQEHHEHERLREDDRVRRLQQEEFHKRQEEISRRRAEMAEKKQQENANANAGSGSTSFPTSSSTSTASKSQTHSSSTSTSSNTSIPIWNTTSASSNAGAPTWNNTFPPSNTNNSAWNTTSTSSNPTTASWSSTSSSSTNATTSTPTWTAASAWAKATTASSTASANASRTPPAQSATKPRTGSVSSGTYQTAPAPGNSQGTSGSFQSTPGNFQSTSGTFQAGSSPRTSVPLSESEWARRQADNARKQQETFRLEQERLEADRQAKEANKIMTKEDVVHLFEYHERVWTKLPAMITIHWGDFPWPMLKRPAGPDEITSAAINAYMSSPHYPEKDKSKTQKDRIKEHIRRWHPDRFETKLLVKVGEGDKVKVQEGAGAVVRILNDLLTRSQDPVLNMFA